MSFFVLWCRSQSKRYWLFLFFLYFSLGLSLRFLGLTSGDSIQKLFFLLGVLYFCLLFRFSRGAFSIFFLFVASVLLIFLPGVEYEVSLKTFLFAFLGMLPAFTFPQIRFDAGFLDDFVRALAHLPFLSVIIFLLVLPFVWNEFFLIDYMGSFRLRPLMHPTHFAMLCMSSLIYFIFVSLRDNRLRFFPILILLALIFLTASRGAILSSIILSLPLVKFWRLAYIWRYFLLLSPVLLLTFYFLVSNILLRNISVDGDGLNFSGRDIAWEFFLSFSLGFEIFGNGLGFVTNVTDGIDLDNLSAFTTPHNEFIRFYVDLGLVGSFLYWMSILLLFGYAFYGLGNKFLFFGFSLFFSVVFFSYVDNFFSTPQSLYCFFILMKYFHISKFGGKHAN